MLLAVPRPLLSPTALFLAGALTIWTSSLAIVAALPGFERQALVAAGVAFDLTVTVALLAWLLPVRRGGWPAATLAPLFALSALAAARLVPDPHGALAAPLAAGALAAEVTLLGWIAARVTRIARRPGDRGLDRFERCRVAARELIGENRAAGIVAFELAVLAYAFGRRDRPPSAPRSRHFSCHRRSGYTATLAALGLVAVAEIVPIHQLLARWSPVAAAIVTALGLYALIYLVADARAAAARPLELDDERLLVRTGIRWTATIDRAAIVAVDRRSPRASERPLSLSLVGPPNLWLTLDRPCDVLGVYGVRRTASVLGIRVDDPERLAAALLERRAAP